MKFNDYREHFSKMQHKKLITVFPNVFIASVLKNYLINIYNSGPKLLVYTCELVYEQAVKLLKLILSIPVTSASTECSMSTLKSQDLSS